MSVLVVAFFIKTFFVNTVLLVIRLFILGCLMKRIHICMIHTKKHTQKFCTDGTFWMLEHRYGMLMSLEILCIELNALYHCHH